MPEIQTIADSRVLADLSRTRRYLQEDMDRGLHFGGQVYVSQRTETTHRAAGAGGDTGGDEGLFRTASLVIGERQPGQAMTSDTLMIWLSSSKPITAVALGQLWERGRLDLDDPIARHVPEFAERGKDKITLRHALTHTGGFRLLNVGWPDASWDEIIATICKSRPEPRWVPGEKAGYHLAASWFILGEVVRRIDGRSYADYVRQEIFEPCGMDDSWVGMPADRFAAYGDRIGRMYGTEKSAGTDLEPLKRMWHRDLHVQGCSPGGNGYGPIHQLGRFYEMLLQRGTWDGRRILRPQTIEALTTPHRVGLYDHTFKHKLDWGLGFIVNSEHYGADLPPYGYGRHASRRTFGHSGFQSSTGFADPLHGLVVAMVVNGNPGEPRHTQRLRRLTEAVYEDLGLAEAIETA